jgi:cation:H+ antiporter
VSVPVPTFARLWELTWCWQRRLSPTRTTCTSLWAAGIWLSDTTDTLSSRFHLGQALAGTILLAVGTNLPEIAITSTAAIHHNLGIAVGNLLGGIAIQTVVLAALDIAVHGNRPLTYRAASITLILESILVVAVLAVAILGTRLAPSLVFLRITPENLLILLIWLGGLWLHKHAPQHVSWTLEHPDKQQKPAGQSQKGKDQKAGSTTKVMIKFGVAAIATLGAGVALEESGVVMAGHLGLSGVLFGATVLAASTSIPELSTGITSVHMEDYELAMSDIFGGNAFLPVLFLLASVLSGTAVLPHAHNTDIYLAALGILLTATYSLGLLLRPSRRFARMGIDSWLVLVLYAVGIAGLLFVRNG